jgi:hypothetical protein
VYPKVSGLSHKEINKSNNKHSLRSNKKSYGNKTYYTDPQNGDTTAPSGIELHHLQFSLRAASPETFGYTPIQISGEFFYMPTTSLKFNKVKLS